MISIFLQGIKKRQIPQQKQAQKCKHFYNCLACIMTYNLQTLCLKSMKEYTDYMMDVGVGIHTAVQSNSFIYSRCITSNSSFTLCFFSSFRDIIRVL